MNKFSGNWEFNGKDEASMFYLHCRAYIDAVNVLCKEMGSPQYPIEYSHSRVISFTQHHAYELFFKYALIRAGKESKTHHNIAELYQEYLEVYPGEEYFMDPPSSVIPMGYGPEDDIKHIVEKSRKAARNRHQAFEYPTDKQGNPFNGKWEAWGENDDNEYWLTELDAFYLPDFIKMAESLSKRISELHELIETRYNKGY